MFDHLFDYLRLAVAIFSAGVLVLIISTAVRNMRRLWSAGDMRFLVWGQLFRGLGLTVLLCDEIFRTWSRIGRDDFTYETPMLQVATIFLLLAWHFLDRRAYSRIDVDATLNMMRSKDHPTPPFGMKRIGDA